MVDGRKSTIALDVMGADGGPSRIIRGGVNASAEKGDGVHVLLVGNKDSIEKELKQLPDVPDNISVVHAESEVPMTMSASEGVRMRGSSIAVGMKKVKDGEADAFISPGNTGAVMATSMLTLGRIKGVIRPAIATLFPTGTGRPTVVLDSGANADCKPIHLAQFAIMGSVYSAAVMGNESPRVGLVSIGEERSKGNELVFGATKLLSKSNMNFVGNIEGRDVLSGTIHVAVTDGFTGNILLKFYESIQPMLVKAVQRQIQTNIFSRFGVWLMLPFLKRMRSRFDYAKAGGAPLLGVDGNVIICHGASSARAITNAIYSAVDMASNNLRERIRAELITNQFGKSNGSKAKSQDSGDRVVCASGSDNER